MPRIRRVCKVYLMPWLSYSLYTPDRASGIAGDANILDDGQLLTGFVSGNSHLASRFVQRFQVQVYDTAKAVVGDPAMAEEVSQQAFERMWRRAGTYDPARGPLGPWVVAIARNTSIDEIRRRRRRIDSVALGCTEPTTTEPDPADAAVVSDQLRRALRALDRLPREQRRAVRLAAWHAHTAQEVADLEGIPLGTAKSRIRNGLIRLRAEMNRS